MSILLNKAKCVNCNNLASNNTDKKDTFGEQMLTTLSNVARLYTGISHTLCISSPKRVDYSKLCVLLNFCPKLSWHVATLLYHQSRNNLVERGETQNLSQLEVGNIFVSKCPALGLFAICWLVKLSQATWDTAEGWLSKPATWFCSSLSQWTQPVYHWGPTYPGPSFPNLVVTLVQDLVLVFATCPAYILHEQSFLFSLSQNTGFLKWNVRPGICLMFCFWRNSCFGIFLPKN